MIRYARNRYHRDIQEQTHHCSVSNDTQNAKLFRNFSALDISESGSSGNVTAYGYITGTYTRSE